MSDDSEAKITMTQSELTDMVTKIAGKSTESTVFACVALAFDQYASAIETATVETRSPQARAGAEAALRKAAHEAREMATAMRNRSNGE